MSYVPFIYSNMRFVRCFMIKWRRDPVSFYVSRILSVSIGLLSSKVSDAINVMDNYLIKKSNLPPYFIDSIHFIMCRSVIVSCEECLIEFFSQHSVLFIRINLFFCLYSQRIDSYASLKIKIKIYLNYLLSVEKKSNSKLGNCFYMHFQHWLKISIQP